MFSVPPATTAWASPHWIAWAASITAFMPEPQTLLTVVAPTETGSPAPMAAWRATFCPRPAPTTLPRITSSTWSGGHARAVQRFLDRHTSQGGRRDFGQGAQVTADRRARAAGKPNFVDHESCSDDCS